MITLAETVDMLTLPENLRQAMVHYRALFEELVSEPKARVNTSRIHALVINDWALSEPLAERFRVVAGSSIVELKQLRVD
jgi:hypothetical protein